MIDIVIKGGCTSREAFNYQKEQYGIDLFNVSDYIFHKPIAALASEKVKEVDQSVIDKMKLAMINNNSVQDFIIKQVDSSFSKNFLADKKMEKTNNDRYFLMDFISERKKLIEIGDSFIEYRKEFVDILKKEKINFQVIENTKELIFRYIDNFMEIIKSCFPEENIILHKAFAVNITKIGDMIYPLTSTFADPYNTSRINGYSLLKVAKLNNLYLQIYNYIEKKYPNVLVLELPFKDYYSSVNHKYGRSIFHYNEKYYLDFLKRLKELIIDKINLERTKQKINQENIDLVSKQYSDSQLILNIHKSNIPTGSIRNPEELLLGPTNKRLDYDINTGGKQLIKSYLLKDSSPGILVFSNAGRLLGKIIFNKKSNLTHVYTLYKNKEIKSITTINKQAELTTKLYDLSRKDITEKGFSKLERNKRTTYSYYNEFGEILIKIFISLNANTRIIFYDGNRINVVIDLKNDIIHRVVKYSSGLIDEEFEMGEYINLGKVQTNIKYKEGAKSVRYIFSPAGDLQSKSIFLESGQYLKTEKYYDGKKVKEIFYHDGSAKISQVIYISDSGNKIEEFYKNGKKKSISYYNKEGELIKKLVRESEKHFFQLLEKDKNFN